MRKRFGQALRIGLAPDAAALVQASRWQRGRAAVLAEHRFAGDEAGAAEQLRRLFDDAKPAGWPVTVVLSDELARIWQVTPPAAASRMGDLQAAAALRFQSLFAAPASQWKISADWDATKPFLAAAMPAALLAQLQQAALEHRFHLVEIVPQLVASMNQWRRLRRPGAWFGQVHAGVLTVAACQGDALAAVRTSPVPVGADRAWFDGVVAREALRLGLAQPALVQVCGEAPASWGGVGSGGSVCSLLETGQGAGWSPVARLALAGSAA